MPLVHIYLRKGHPPEYLASVSNAVHEALVQSAGAPADGKFHIFHQLEPQEIVANRSYGGVSRSENLIVLEITLKIGRTLEVKKALYADLVRRLGEAADVRKDDVLVSLIEVPGDNWSFGNGLATYA